VFAKASHGPVDNPAFIAAQPWQGTLFRQPSGIEPDWLSVLRALLDQRPFPAFLLLADLTVCLMNAAASGTLGKVGIAVAPNGMLRLSDAHAGRQLAHAIKEFVADKSAAESPRLLSYELPDGTSRSLTVRPLKIVPKASTQGESAAHWFMVSIRPSLSSFDVSAPRLAATLDLTRAEANLAAALMKGLSLQEYAEQENLKITTVRWHLQNIFDRTGTRGQAELVGMIASLFA
jgi:DNA-binding CsgD family transcriptional regulator